jgi:formylglycine-generating enzyme required for sulfatase activity
VGQNRPNGWGLYDMIGLCYEWNLDWQANSTTNYSGTDPVGPKSGTNRSRRSCNTTTTTFTYFTTATIGTNGESSSHHYRLCIHLKSLFK